MNDMVAPPRTFVETGGSVGEVSGAFLDLGLTSFGGLSRIGDLMGFVNALTVICQDLDHPALIDPAMAASFDHRLQLGLQGRQAGNAVLDLDQAGPRDRVGRGAGLVRIVL